MNLAAAFKSFESRFALTFGLEMIPGASIRFLPVYLAFAGVSPELSASLFTGGYAARLITIAVFLWLIPGRFSAALGNLLLGTGLLFLGAGLLPWHLWLAMILIFVGREVSITSNMAVLLNAPATNRHQLITRALGMMSIHRNVTGPALFDIIYALGWVWVWMIAAISTFLISMVRLFDSQQVNTAFSAHARIPWKSWKALRVVLLLATGTGFVVLEEIWIPRFLSEANLSLSWFFLPYFVFSQGFRFFSLSKEALRADKTGLAIAIVSYTLSCLFLTVSTSPPTVALAGALSGLAGAATTPLFLAWISSVFSSRAAFMTQVVGAVAAIGYASWLSTAHANVFSVVPAVVLVLFVLGLLGTAFPETSSPWRAQRPAAELSQRETPSRPASSG